MTRTTLLILLAISLLVFSELEKPRETDRAGIVAHEQLAYREMIKVKD